MDAQWEAEGFPVLRSGERFALTGSVAKVWTEGLPPNERLQLTVAQGTDRPEFAPVGQEKPLGGFSGSPILSRHRVVGLMTRVVSNTNTAYATNAASIRELSLARECAEALIACPTIDLAALAGTIGNEAANSLREAHGHLQAANKLLEEALRSAGGLETVIDAIAQYAPESAAGLRSELCTLTPVSAAIDHLTTRWVDEEVLKQLIDQPSVDPLMNDIASCADCRPALAMTIRLMATLAYARKHRLAETDFRLALEILLFYHCQLLPALERIPGILRELAAPARGTRPAAAGISTDLGADIQTIESLGETGRQIAIELRAVGDIATAQPPLETPLIALSEAHRFLFNSRAVAMLGRDREIDAADAFLDTGGPFAWWLLLGPAGSGKSRFALEFCLRQTLVWRTGFLPAGVNFNWTTWRPSQPTLIVADDAASRADELRAIVNALRVRSDLRWPVRLLIVERFGKLVAGEGQFVEESWYDRFVGQASAAALIEAASFRAPLELPRLTADVLWKIICAVTPHAGAINVGQDAILRALGQADPDGRPLFAALLADALARGGSTTQWDADALLKSVLHHEEQRWKAQNVTVPEKNLLALSTMVAGLELNVLQSHSQPDILPKPAQFSPERYRSLSGREATTNLAPLEPDILGELFVLERVRPTSSIDRERARVLRELSWHLKPPSMAAFLERTARDFPSHAALPLLLNPEGVPENCLPLLSQVSVNASVYMGAARAISTATEVYRWLKELGAKHSDKPAIRLRQARSAANLIAFAEHPTQARLFYDDLNRLVEESAADSGIREAFARGAHNMVRTYLDAGDANESLAIYQRIHTIAAAHPEEVAIRVDQARSAYNLLDWYGEHKNMDMVSQMHDELKALSSQYDAPKLRELLAKGTVNLISFSNEVPLHIITDFRNLKQEHPAEKEVLVQFAKGLATVISKCPVSDGKDYFAEIESDFADTDDVLSTLIRAKAAGNMLGSFGRNGELKQAQDLYTTKIATLKVGDDPSLAGVQARAAVNLMILYLSDGKPEPAMRMYRNDLSRLAMGYPNLDEVRQSFDFGTNLLKDFDDDLF
jgi:hypothetical protein